MKLILVTLFSLTLFACDGAGRRANLIKTIYDNVTTSTTTGDPDPEAGTILSWECDGYTRLNQVADGVGGYTEETVEKSPDCGWNPPEAGTVSETRCDEYTLVTIFNDGEYGFYEESEEKSEECGYVPVTVTLSKAEGDRFKPAIFDVDLGTNESFEYESTDRTIGIVSVEEDQIIIHGDGGTGTGYIVVAGEEYSYDIVPEPRCEALNYTTDCLGYAYSGRSSGYIYYGEDDDQIVEWQIAYWLYDNRFENIGDNYTFEVGDPDWIKAQETIDKYNTIYEASGIHVRFVLAEGNVGKAKFGAPGEYNNLPGIVRDIGTADVYIGLGTTCPSTCGCAYVSTYFIENSNRATGGLSVCGEYTDLHELGHSIGLAHGPDNSTNQAFGYIFRDFGHGHSTPFCVWSADIMSYNNAIRHNNSQQTCYDQFKNTNNYLENPDAPAGSRDYADSAYHINRIRYDVSLIHCEDGKCAGSPQNSGPPTEVVPEPVLIADEIEKFDDGPERLINEMNRLRRSFDVDLSPMRPK